MPIGTTIPKRGMAHLLLLLHPHLTPPPPDDENSPEQKDDIEVKEDPPSEADPSQEDSDADAGKPYGPMPRTWGWIINISSKGYKGKPHMEVVSSSGDTFLINYPPYGRKLGLLWGTPIHFDAHQEVTILGGKCGNVTTSSAKASTTAPRGTGLLGRLRSYMPSASKSSTKS